MSHPDPTRDYDDFDMMAEQTIWPWIDDESHDSDDVNYDDHDATVDSDDVGCENGPTINCGCINCATWWTY